MEDITVNAELEGVVAAELWKVGIDCRISLGINVVQSVEHKLVVNYGQHSYIR